jgi:uncharacterized protein (TIGR04255 family)
MFTAEELAEVFPRSPLREVAFEVRFPPRLRVPAEIWRLQDNLVHKYPEVGKETNIQANGTITDSHIFQNVTENRMIKVSQQNFVIAFTRYVRFEEFKEEVIEQTQQFCSIFGIDMFSRVGLRYVNEISLPSLPLSLTKHVRPPIRFDSFSEELVDQFALELRTHFKNHFITLRSALLPGEIQTYVLDIDCHTSALTPTQQYPTLLDDFHDSAQRVFLEHITEDYKDILRGAK